MDAVRTVPKNNRRPFVIFIKKGIYNEYVKIPEHVNNVTFIGEGPTKTRITGNTSHNDVLTTFKTATITVSGDGFMARGIGFENMAGPLKYQAVALHVSGDMAIFYNCAMNGYQHTLYAHSNRQFYRQCTITGTIDFIFGDASAVFQDCKMIVSGNHLTTKCAR
ncbi:putative pectinesterase [Helianthus debilis subsp. tardiflorus]